MRLVVRLLLRLWAVRLAIVLGLLPVLDFLWRPSDWFRSNYQGSFWEATLIFAVLAGGAGSLRVAPKPAPKSRTRPGNRDNCSDLPNTPSITGETTPLPSKPKDRANLQ